MTKALEPRSASAPSQSHSTLIDNPRPPTLGGAIAGILLTALLAFLVPQLGGVLALLFHKFAGIGPPPPDGNLLLWLYTQHFFQMAAGLAAIAVAKRWFPGDYALRLPRGATYYREAILWGTAFGVVMLLVDYAPQWTSGATPKLDYPLTFANITAWLAFEGIWVGPTEEIPFRALLVPLMIALWPARLKIRSFDMAWAGIVVAFFFALLHARSFWTEAWPIALGQQTYAFALGVAYAYWLEKSGSIVAPIIGHNVGNLLEFVLLLDWVGAPGR